MNKMKYIMAAALSLTLASCMDGDWDEPTTYTFGNEAIAETNVVSIASLKNQYGTVVFNSANSLRQITTPTQIKATVTGNDIGGNIYNEIAVDDGTGAILVCISQGGLFGQLAVGQQVLIDLNGLYIGGYGQQPEIGTPFTNSSGSTYVSRMPRTLWAQHYRLIGQPNAALAVPEEFDVSKYKDEAYLQAYCGKLMTVKNVKFLDADGTATYAPEEQKDAANCVSRELSQGGKNLGSNTNNGGLVVRTSTYADFAAKKLPEGTVNITGIFTRYRNCWQILMRTEDDIEVVK